MKGRGIENFHSLLLFVVAEVEVVDQEWKGNQDWEIINYKLEYKKLYEVSAFSSLEDDDSLILFVVFLQFRFTIGTFVLCFEHKHHLFSVVTSTTIFPIRSRYQPDQENIAVVSGFKLEKTTLWVSAKNQRKQVRLLQNITQGSTAISAL